MTLGRDVFNEIYRRWCQTPARTGNISLNVWAAWKATSVLQAMRHTESQVRRKETSAAMRKSNCSYFPFHKTGADSYGHPPWFKLDFIDTFPILFPAGVFEFRPVKGSEFARWLFSPHALFSPKTLRAQKDVTPRRNRLEA